MTTRLTDFALPQHILPGASAPCAPTPVGYINRWQNFLDLVFPTDARSSSAPTSADPRIKYPSRRSILLHTNDMAEPTQPLNINTLHNVHVIEELSVEVYAEFIAISHFSLEYLQGCCLSDKRLWFKHPDIWKNYFIWRLSLIGFFSFFSKTAMKYCSSRPKILRRTFLLNTLKAAASVLNNVHVSAPDK